MKTFKQYVVLLFLCFLVVGTVACGLWYMVSFTVPIPHRNFLLFGFIYGVLLVLLLVISEGSK